METIRDAAGVSGAKAYDSQKVTAPEHNTVKEDRTEASVLKEQNNSQEKEQMPGVETAKNAGIACISVSWGFRDRSFLESLGASVIVDSPEEILLHINKGDSQ